MTYLVAEILYNAVKRQACCTKSNREATPRTVHCSKRVLSSFFSGLLSKTVLTSTRLFSLLPSSPVRPSYIKVPRPAHARTRIRTQNTPTWVSGPNRNSFPASRAAQSRTFERTSREMTGIGRLKVTSAILEILKGKVAAYEEEMRDGLRTTFERVFALGAAMSKSLNSWLELMYHALASICFSQS